MKEPICAEARRIFAEKYPRFVWFVEAFEEYGCQMNEQRTKKIDFDTYLCLFEQALAEHLQLSNFNDFEQDIRRVAVPVLGEELFY